MTREEFLAAYKKALEEKTTFDIEAQIDTLLADALTAVNTKNQELLSKLSDAKKKADGLPEDFTAEKWKSLLKLEKDVDLSKLNGDEALTKQKEQLETAHAAELTAAQKITSGLKGQITTLLIDNAATAAITEAKGNAPLLLPHLRNHLQVVEVDGNYKAVVIDPANGTERFSLTKPGEKMGLDELVTEFKGQDLFKPAFTGSSGGGAPPGGGGGGGKQINPFVKGPNYSLTEQAKIMNENKDLGTQMQSEAKTIHEQQAQQAAAGGAQ